MEHLTLEEIEAFVAGEDPHSDARVRAHVRVCARCARALAREARLDEAMRGAARQGREHVPTTAPARPASDWRRHAAIAAALVGIAAAAWLVRPRGPEPVDTHVLAPDAPGLRVGVVTVPGREALVAGPALETPYRDLAGFDVGKPTAAN